MERAYLKSLVLGRIYRAGVVQSCALARKPTSAGGYVDRTMADTYALVYVLSGSGVFTDWNGERHEVTAGCAIQMPAGKRHSVVQTPDGQWLEAWITIDGRFTRSLTELRVFDEARPLIRPGVDRSLIEQFTQIRDQLRNAPDRDLPATVAAAHQLLVDLHTADHRQATVDPLAVLIENACTILGRDLDQRQDLSALIGGDEMSYERFRKIFRDRIGLSPGEYRIRRRIDQARAMITQHRSSNKEIAYALGYADPFTFSKQFKRFVGVSPEEFRGRM